VLQGIDPDDVRSGPGAARDLFVDFDPVTRPVLWRVLVIQILLYWCFQRVVLGEGLPQSDEIEQVFCRSEIYARVFEALQSRPDDVEAERLTATTSVAVAYFRDHLAPALRRVQLLTSSESNAG
jgi:hypothetical protein